MKKKMLRSVLALASAAAVLGLAAPIDVSWSSSSVVRADDVSWISTGDVSWAAGPPDVSWLAVHTEDVSWPAVDDPTLA